MSGDHATSGATGAWPSLRVDDWEATRDTLHVWTQAVGKIRLAKAPMVDHWWQVPLYVTPRGLATSTIPDGFADHPIEPTAAHYYREGGQFLLPYEAVRTAPDPDATLLDFLQTTYEAAADHGDWDRDALEDDPAVRANPR